MKPGIHHAGGWLGGRLRGADRGRPASLLRWYPRAWREQHGEELLALIQDTVEDGRPTWRLRLGVAWGGLRERGHQAGRVVRASVKWRTVLDRWSLFVTGLVLATVPVAVTGPPPQARGWQAAAADGMLAAVAMTGVVVLVSGLTALPALIRFLRAGGWPKIRRRVAWAAGATVPRRVSRAVRKGRRLRVAASGAAVVNPSAQRTYGRHRA